MKIAKGLLRILAVAFTIYIFIFIVGFVLMVSCLQYSAQHDWGPPECGQDSFTKMIMKTHAPVINLIHWLTMYE